MDMMEMRFRMMAMMGGGGMQLPTGWHFMQITNPTDITLGNGLANLCANNIPSCQYAIGVVDYDYSQGAPSGNGVAIDFTWLNGVSGSYYHRTVNSAYDNATRPMTDAYLCNIPQGKTIAVLYLEQFE